jgi:UDP-glucose:(heptosyl)LPS alpha-1,3-glucosyltransferase
MRIAFAIVSLFPGGGLQRDCVEIAKLVRDQGHDVVIYTCRLHDHTLADDIPILLLQNGAFTNHNRQYQFALDFLKEASGQYDLIVGFDKLLELDVLYCADPSMAYRVLQQPLLRLFRRYRRYVDIEKNSFAPGKKTRMILLSQNQVGEYRSAWDTESSRVLLVPPTLSLARRQPDCRTDGTRQALRSTLGLADGDWVWLSIGVQPNTKGTDRAINALTRFPNAKLLIAGLTETNYVSVKLAKRTRQLGVAHRVKWLGHREDVSHLMAAADLLVHPARYDTTGTVILEAVVNGLPVITTAACGYARHVDSAGAGIVIREPFEFRLFLTALEQARDPAVSRAWSEAGAEYGRNPTLYQGRLRAAEAIVQAAHEKLHGLHSEAVPRLVLLGDATLQDVVAPESVPGPATNGSVRRVAAAG